LSAFRKIRLNNRNRWHKEQGFTLVEVLVALTIFAIGLLALAGMQITGIQGSNRAQSMSAKNALAEGIAEEILAMDGSDVFLTTEVTDTAWDFDRGTPDEIDSTVELEGAGDCSALVTVDSDPEIDGTPYTGLTQITVTVSNPYTLSPDVTKTVMKRRY
jgi:type IV pilus assembly protein PilV